MTLLRTALFLAAPLLAACANHEGLYEPACIAYEGHRINLEDGRFEWRRFTDQRVIGEDGKVMDPFPGFPKTGTYSRSRGRLEMQTDDGESINSWFVVERDGQTYLLTGKQHEAVSTGKAMPECVLALRGAAS